MSEQNGKWLQILEQNAAFEMSQDLKVLIERTPEMAVDHIANLIIGNDEPKRRFVATQLIVGLKASSISQRERCAIELIQIGRLCIPYLREVLTVDPSDQLVNKVQNEIEALDRDLRQYESDLTPDLQTETAMSIFSDLILPATVPAVVFGTDEEGFSEKQLLAFIEINCDAWRNARLSILHLGVDLVDSLEESLNSGEVDTRRAVVQLLGLIDVKRSRQALLKVLNDSDVYVRDEAVLSLARVKDATTARFLALAYETLISD